MSEEYPIHPTLDSLIRFHKEFSQVTFPRGIPAPTFLWKDILQSLTKFEAEVVKVSHEYMCGEEVVLNKLNVDHEFINLIKDFEVRSADDSEYLKKLSAYHEQVKVMVGLIENCARELGNPCNKYKGNNYD